MVLSRWSKKVRLASAVVALGVAGATFTLATGVASAAPEPLAKRSITCIIGTAAMADRDRSSTFTNYGYSPKTVTFHYYGHGFPHHVKRTVPGRTQYTVKFDARYAHRTVCS